LNLIVFLKITVVFYPFLDVATVRLTQEKTVAVVLPTY